MKTLSPKEEQIMELFWQNGPLFVKEMLELFDEPKPHFNTVSTFVRGLEEKGFVAHKAFGNSYQYYAVVTADEFKKRTLKGIISKYFNNSYLGVVSTLVKEEKIQLDDLKKLIAEVENQDKNKDISSVCISSDLCTLM